MKLIGNLIWLVFGGLIGAIAWSIAGLLWCVTIIGIPFGIQCFKIARLVLWPFGSQVTVGDFGFGGLLANVVWIVLFGWELCIGHLITGVIFWITIVGIPFGNQHFKFAKLSLIPFGARID